MRNNIKRTKLNFNLSSLISHLSSLKGFTLIELLIVIVIIGVLATVFVSNYSGVRQRARDSQRKADLRQIQTALELYNYDQGVYPASLPGCLGNLAFGSATYMQKIPCDPLASATYYNNGNYYYTAPGGTGYTLCACLENVNDIQGGTNSTCGTLASSPPVISSPPPRLGLFSKLANLIQGSVNLGKKEVSSLFSKLATIPQTVFAAGVEVKVVSIVLDATGPYYRGQSVPFHFVINNYGASPASLGVYTQGYDNRSIQPPCNTIPGPPPDGDAGTTVHILLAGETVTTSWIFTVPTADGTYRLGIFTDFTCNYAEINEIDNYLTISYTVLGPPPPTPTPTPTPTTPPPPTPPPPTSPPPTPTPTPTPPPTFVCTGKFFVLESQ